MVVRLKDLNSENDNKPHGLVRLRDLQPPTTAELTNEGKLPAIDFRQTPLAKAIDSTPVPESTPVQTIPNQQTETRKGRDLPVIGPILRGLDAFSGSPAVQTFDYAAGKAMGVPDNMMTAQPMSTGNRFADAAIGFAGSTAGFLTNPTMPVGVVPTGPASNFFEHPKIQQIAQSAGNKAEGLLPNAGNTLLRNTVNRGVTGAVQGAAGGVAYAPFQTLISGGDVQDIPQHALDLGLQGAAFGGVLGAASPAVKRAFEQMFQRKPQNIPPELLTPPESNTQPILALPDPRPRFALPAPRPRGNVNNVETPDVIHGQGKVEPLGLPEPNVLPPTSAKIGQRVNPYRQKFENLIRVANQQNFTPGREYEELQSLWSQMASRHDPSLDQLIELAYPSKPNRITPDLVQRARSTQEQRNLYGAGMPVRSMSERYPNGGVMGNVDAPLTQSRRVLSPGRSVQPGVEITPPQRRFATVDQPVQDGVESSALQNQIGQIPKAASNTPKVPLERGFATTIKESPKTNEAVRSQIQSEYKPLTNEETLAKANKRIDKDLENAANYVLGNSRLTADKVATGMRLIDEFTKQGNHARAVSIVEKLAPELTKAGQSIQAVSMYDRLSPNGVLLYAQRLAQKANENIPVTAKEIKVTPEMSADLTNLAEVSRKMTGVKELSNNVIDIMERAKSGEKLTESEQQAVKQFVSEARQFVKETQRKPMVKPPKQPQDERIRDNVISFLDAQEQAAKERLRSRGITISSTPLDVYADYAVIGAAKLAKGVVKFTDWSEQMAKELGEEIRPYLQNIYERSVEAFNQTTKQVSKATISQAETITERLIKNKGLQGEEADYLRELAKKVSSLSGDAKTVASQDLQAVLQGLERSGFWQKVSTTQTLSQLLNPKTLLTRNPLGNELFYRLERLNKYITTPIDIARSKITRSERTVTFRTNNQGEYWKNWIRGAVAGWKGVNPEGLATQFDIRPQTFNSKWNPLTYMEKVTGAALKSFDYASYKRAVNQTVGELATLRAINEGQGRNKALIEKYIREADDNILSIADEYGRYITFQDNNVISTGLSALKRGLNFKRDFGFGDFVLKYPRTPGALLMRSIEYSPAGFLRSAYILAKPYLRRGEGPDPREVMHALTRAIVGTGLTGMGYFLADVGIITGEASKDKDIRELQKMAGQGQYQVNLSALKRWVASGFDQKEAKFRENDQLYTYDWAQPVAVALSIGANINKNIKDKTKKENTVLGALGAGYESFAGGVNTLTEQSVLQGLKRAAEGYPGQTVTDKIMSVLGDVPASFVPTALNQANQLIDNTKRETYDPSQLQQVVNRLKVKVPGMAQKLPQQFDTLGRPKEVYPGGSNNLFNVLLNPGYSNRYNLTPEAKLVVDLINETDNTTIAPRVPSKSISVRLPGGKNQSQKLTAEQFSRMQQLAGEETQKRLERINPNASNDAKIRAITKALNDAGEKARTLLKREMGVH